MTFEISLPSRKFIEIELLFREIIPAVCEKKRPNSVLIKQSKCKLMTIAGIHSGPI